MIDDFAPGDDNVFDPGDLGSAAFRAEPGTGPPFIHSPLSEMLEREPISCRAYTPIRSALEAMNRHRIGSMIVVDGNSLPIGILTLPDVLSRVALPVCNLDDPISGVMTSGVMTLPRDATLCDAALTMIRRRIRHVVVVNEGRLAGVVTQNDLFHRQRIEARHLSAQIRVAPDLDALKHRSTEIRARAHDMLVQGTGIEQLIRFVAALNDLLTQRVIELVFVDQDLRDIEWCWIALGSEGRFEQTFATDQDNAIVFAPPAGMDAEDARNTLLPLARRVNHALAECGFPLCRGNIMSGSPACCLTLDEWRRRFGHWVNGGDPDGLLNGSIFFDLRPLYGEASLVEALQDWLLEATRANGRFLHQVAANALRNPPPLGHIRDFVLEGEGDKARTLDIKVQGMTIFSDAARIFSLAAGVGETNTLKRLRRAGPLVDVPSAEVEVWVDSFLVLQRLRLEHQHMQYAEGRPMTNRLDPYRLHELDRLMLKESLRQAKKVQSRLALDYRL